MFLVSDQEHSLAGDRRTLSEHDAQFGSFRLKNLSVCLQRKTSGSFFELKQSEVGNSNLEMVSIRSLVLVVCGPARHPWRECSLRGFFQ